MQLPQFFLSLAVLYSVLITRSVRADFHYGVERCAAAGGGFTDSGVIVAAQHDSCSYAQNVTANSTEYNFPPKIPTNTTLPTGYVCYHNVTIDLTAMTWNSTSIYYGTPMSGSCTKVGVSPGNSTGLNTTCTGYQSQCTWTDQISCNSTICNHFSPPVNLTSIFAAKGK